MNNCIYIRKRKGKPFCKHYNKQIEFKQCKDCPFKEYKQRSYKPIKQVSKKRVFVKKETYNTVYERDGGLCRLCGINYNLHLHHIYYRSKRKDLINDVNNCIMLCSNCHCKVHSNKKKWQPILLKKIGGVK